MPDRIGHLGCGTLDGKVLRNPARLRGELLPTISGFEEPNNCSGQISAPGLHIVYIGSTIEASPRGIL
jgi:hypothetical protein